MSLELLVQELKAHGSLAVQPLRQVADGTLVFRRHPDMAGMGNFTGITRREAKDLPKRAGEVESIFVPHRVSDLLNPLITAREKHCRPHEPQKAQALGRGAFSILPEEAAEVGL